MEMGQRRPPNPAMPYREDCWSEGETAALVEAWGDRFLELNRGHLRAKHWQEVADAVNSRRGAEGRPRRTDVQCKNRVDTLKKKYKIEKARIEGGGLAAVGGSQWPFYDRLDVLIGSSPPSVVAGSNTSGSKRKSSPSLSPPMALPLPFYHKGTPLPTASLVDRKPSHSLPAALPLDGSSFHKAAAAAAAAAADDVELSDSESISRSMSPLPPPLPHVVKAGKKVVEKMNGRKKGHGIRELAKAIEKFAEMYERVEEVKQRQEMEMEKQRMDFMKGIEFQRMQIFVDSQVQIEKMKRAKFDVGGGGNLRHGERRGAAEVIRSVAALPFLSNPPFI